MFCILNFFILMIILHQLLTSCNAGKARQTFQAHIVEQQKTLLSYRLIVDTWESVQANLNVLLFARGTIASPCELYTRTKPNATEFMNVSRL